MIAKIILSTVVTMFLSGGIYTYTVECDETASHVTIESIDSELHGTDVSKAILYKGEIIPMIELPTVDITAPRKTDDMVEAIIVDGEAYPSILLDEVVITPAA
jgi:hypothetical protein